MTNYETKEPTVRDMTAEEIDSIERVSETDHSSALEREADDYGNRMMNEYLQKYTNVAGATATLEGIRRLAKELYLKSRQEKVASPTVEDIVSRLDITEDVGTQPEHAPAVFNEEEQEYIQRQLAQAFGEQWPADAIERKQLTGPIVEDLARRVVEWSEGKWDSFEPELRETTISAALQQQLGKQLKGRRS